MRELQDDIQHLIRGGEEGVAAEGEEMVGMSLEVTRGTAMGDEDDEDEVIVGSVVVVGKEEEGGKCGGELFELKFIGVNWRGWTKKRKRRKIWRSPQIEQHR